MLKSEPILTSTAAASSTSEVSIQRSARRANGDAVHITGDSRGEVEHCRRLLMRLARRYHLMMIEIAELAGVPTGRMAKMPELALAEVTGGPPIEASELETRLAAMRAPPTMR